MPGRCDDRCLAAPAPLPHIEPLEKINRLYRDAFRAGDDLVDGASSAKIDIGARWSAPTVMTPDTVIPNDGLRQGESSSQRSADTIKVVYVDRGPDTLSAAEPIRGRKSRRLRRLHRWEPKATGRSVLLSWLMSSNPIWFLVENL